MWPKEEKGRNVPRSGGGGNVSGIHLTVGQLKGAPEVDRIGRHLFFGRRNGGWGEDGLTRTVCCS